MFVISWVNPDERHRDLGWDAYMTLGPLAALEAIEQATGEAEANVIGYCIGGTLLATTLGHMAATATAGSPRPPSSPRSWTSRMRAS